MDNGWYKVTYSGKTGYVSSDYITITTEPDVTETASSDLGAQIVAYAEEYLGTPYVLGGNGPISSTAAGFTKYVYSHFGYTLNRTATGPAPEWRIRQQRRASAGRFGIFQISHQQTRLPCGDLYRKR